MNILKKILFAKSNLNFSGRVKYKNDSTPIIDRFGKVLPHLCVLEPENLLILEGDTKSSFEGLGFTIEIEPQTGVTEEMEATFMSLTSTLPEKATVAVTAFASSLIDKELSDYSFARLSGINDSNLSAPTREILKKAVLRRNELFKKASKNPLSEKAGIFTRHFRVWLSVVIPGKDPFNPELKAKAIEVRETLITLLKQNHLFRCVWDKNAFSATLSELLNPQKVLAETFVPTFASDFEELRNQIVSQETEIEVKEDSITFKSNGVESVDAVGLSVEHYPSRISLATTSLLLGDPGRSGSQIPCPFLLTTWLQVPNQAQERLKISTQRVRAKQMMSTPLGALTPYYADRYKELLLAQNSFDSGVGVGRVLHQLVLFAPSKRINECIQSAQAVGRRARMDWVPNKALHLQALLTSLPCGAGPLIAQDAIDLDRFPRRTLGTALSGLPIVTEYRGNGARSGFKRKTPLLMLTGRKGEISLIDPFANQHGSYSITVVGKPGSGKSVVMNELALSTLALNGRTWILDIGRSYEKLSKVMGGVFLEFKEDSIWDLNPFQFLLSNSQEDKTEMVARIYSELMSSKGLTDYALTLLIRAISEVNRWAQSKGKVATTDDLYTKLTQLKTRDGTYEAQAEEMAAMLYPYTSSGALGAWFNGLGKKINFDNPLTILELEGLRAHPRLKSGVLLTLMLYIEEAMEKLPRSIPKLVAIDEAWDLMGAGAAGNFIETGYRRARKLNGSFVTATQSITDYWLSETAQAAWRCADTRIFLRQDADSLEALEHDGRFAQDAWLKSAITSLTTVQGAWSEMVVKVGDDPAAIGRLLLDDFSRVLYSSHPKDVSEVSRWLASGATLVEAIDKVAKEEFVQ